jgi:WD40 repeat protein
VHDEPRHLDLRWARSEIDLDLRDTRFRAAVADVAATIHGIPKDELENEDVRQHRRARRLARSAVASLAFLLVVALVAGGVAVVQRRRADQKTAAANAARLTSDAGRLAALARASPADQLDLSLLLAVQGRHLQVSDTTDGALEEVLARSTPGLDRIVPLGAPATCGQPVSRDGRFAAAGTLDGFVHLIDIGTGQWRVLPNDLTGSIKCPTMAFSADGNRLVTAGTTGRVVVWDTTTARPDGTLPIRSGTEALYAFEARPGRIVTSALHGGLGTVVVWDTHDPARPRQLTQFSVQTPDPFAPLVQLADRADPDRIAIGDSLATQVWNLPTHVLAYPPLPGIGVGESPDGSTLVTATPSGYRFWDVHTGRARGAPLSGITPPVIAPGVWYSPDGTMLAVKDVRTSTVKVIDLASRRELLSIPVSDAGTPGPFLRDGRASVFDGQAMTLWRVGARAPAPFAVALGAPTGVATAFFSADGARLFVATQAGLEAWNTTTDARLPAPPVGPYSLVYPPAFSADGQLVATTARDGTVEVRDPTTGRRLAVVPVHGPGVGLTWSPRGRILAVATGDGSVTLWNLTDPAQPARLAAQTAPGFPKPAGGSLLFSPDGHTLAVEGANFQLHVLRASPISLIDVATGQLRHLLRGPGLFADMAFSPDSRTLALAVLDPESLNGRVIEWDTATGTARTTLRLPYYSFSVAFVAGGRWLAVSQVNVNAISRATSARLDLIDATTQQPIGAPILVRGDAVSLSVDQPGGYRMASGTTNDLGGPILWDLDPTHWETIACRLAGRNLTHAEWNQYLPGRPYQQTCPQWPQGT